MDISGAADEPTMDDLVVMAAEVSVAARKKHNRESKSKSKAFFTIAKARSQHKMDDAMCEECVAVCDAWDKVLLKYRSEKHALLKANLNTILHNNTGLLESLETRMREFNNMLVAHRTSVKKFVSELKSTRIDADFRTKIEMSPLMTQGKYDYISKTLDGDDDKYGDGLTVSEALELRRLREDLVKLRGDVERFVKRYNFAVRAFMAARSKLSWFEGALGLNAKRNVKIKLDIPEVFVGVTFNWKKVAGDSVLTKLESEPNLKSRVKVPDDDILTVVTDFASYKDILVKYYSKVVLLSSVEDKKPYERVDELILKQINDDVVTTKEESRAELAEHGDFLAPEGPEGYAHATEDKRREEKRVYNDLLRLTQVESALRTYTFPLVGNKSLADAYEAIIRPDRSNEDIYAFFSEIKDYAWLCKDDVWYAVRRYSVFEDRMRECLNIPVDSSVADRFKLTDFEVKLSALCAVMYKLHIRYYTDDVLNIENRDLYDDAFEALRFFLFHSFRGRFNKERALETYYMSNIGPIRMWPEIMEVLAKIISEETSGAATGVDEGALKFIENRGVHLSNAYDAAQKRGVQLRELSELYTLNPLVPDKIRNAVDAYIGNRNAMFEIAKIEREEENEMSKPMENALPLPVDFNGLWMPLSMTAYKTYIGRFPKLTKHKRYSVAVERYGNKITGKNALAAMQAAVANDNGVVRKIDAPVDGESGDRRVLSSGESPRKLQRLEISEDSSEEDENTEGSEYDSDAASENGSIDALMEERELARVVGENDIEYDVSGDIDTRDAVKDMDRLVELGLFTQGGAVDFDELEKFLDTRKAVPKGFILGPNVRHLEDPDAHNAVSYAVAHATGDDSDFEESVDGDDDEEEEEEEEGEDVIMIDASESEGEDASDDSSEDDEDDDIKMRVFNTNVFDSKVRFVEIDGSWNLVEYVSALDAQKDTRVTYVPLPENVTLREPAPEYHTSGVIACVRCVSPDAAGVVSNRMREFNSTYVKSAVRYVNVPHNNVDTWYQMRYDSVSSANADGRALYLEPKTDDGSMEVDEYNGIEYRSYPLSDTEEDYDEDDDEEDAEADIYHEEIRMRVLNSTTRDPSVRYLAFKDSDGNTSWHRAEYVTPGGAEKDDRVWYVDVPDKVQLGNPRTTLGDGDGAQRAFGVIELAPCVVEAGRDVISKNMKEFNSTYAESPFRYVNVGVDSWYRMTYDSVDSANADARVEYADSESRALREKTFELAAPARAMDDARKLVDASLVARVEDVKFRYDASLAFNEFAGKSRIENLNFDVFDIRELDATRQKLLHGQKEINDRKASANGIIAELLTKYIDDSSDVNLYIQLMDETKAMREMNDTYKNVNTALASLNGDLTWALNLSHAVRLFHAGTKLSEAHARSDTLEGACKTAILKMELDFKEFTLAQSKTTKDIAKNLMAFVQNNTIRGKELYKDVTMRQINGIKASNMEVLGAKVKAAIDVAIDVVKTTLTAIPGTDEDESEDEEARRKYENAARGEVEWLCQRLDQLGDSLEHAAAVKTQKDDPILWGFHSEIDKHVVKVIEIVHGIAGNDAPRRNMADLSKRLDAIMSDAPTTKAALHEKVSGTIEEMRDVSLKVGAKLNVATISDLLRPNSQPLLTNSFVLVDTCKKFALFALRSVSTTSFMMFPSIPAFCIAELPKVPKVPKANKAAAVAVEDVPKAEVENEDAMSVDEEIVDSDDESGSDDEENLIRHGDEDVDSDAGDEDDAMELEGDDGIDVQDDDDDDDEDDDPLAAPAPAVASDADADADADDDDGDGDIIDAAIALPGYAPWTPESKKALLGWMRELFVYALDIYNASLKISVTDDIKVYIDAMNVIVDSVMCARDAASLMLMYQMRLCGLANRSKEFIYEYDTMLADIEKRWLAADGRSYPGVKRRVRCHGW